MGIWACDADYDFASGFAKLQTLNRVAMQEG
jgi:hypothetical protein